MAVVAGAFGRGNGGDAVGSGTATDQGWRVRLTDQRGANRVASDNRARRHALESRDIECVQSQQVARSALTKVMLLISPYRELSTGKFD